MHHREILKGQSELRDRMRKKIMLEDQSASGSDTDEDLPNPDDKGI